ncbi:MAG: CoA transferase [Chloroflexi bacterium]|nr:CoA transferase [Chloroflexota bacterium]
MEQPLQGIRVLDLTRLAPGPYASLALANLGAEVIKIERPRFGDPLRYMSRFGFEGGALLFELLNRNKKSLTLNLRTPEGKAILLELARHADVLLEGFRPGVMKRLGFDYEALSELNPRLVYASLSGYGQTGPHHLRAGHDLNYIALGGLLGLTGGKDGHPVIPGVPVADLVGGLWMAFGVVAALFEREHSGRGQYLDISMLSSITALLAIPLAGWLTTGQVPQRGQMWLTGKQACYNVYETADGKYMALGALEPEFWRAFCQAVGHPEWQARQYDSDQASLIAEVAALFRTQPRDYWVELFAHHDCCCEPVLELDEVFAHPQAMHCQLLREGELAMPLDSRGTPHQPAPRLGQHTSEILTELGYTMADIERLQQKGVI